MGIWDSKRRKRLKRIVTQTQERPEYGHDIQSNRIENTLNVQIHDLSKCTIRMCVKFLPPGSPSIGEQDVHMVRSLFHFLHQHLNISYLRAVGGHRDGLSAWTLVGKCIEGSAGLVAGSGFARGYIYLRTAGLKKSELVNTGSDFFL